MMTAQTTICGIDEAGRGAFAGPLVAAAVILPKTGKTISRRAGFRIRDSKTLSNSKRRQIYAILKRHKATIAVEIISARSINNHGIGWANREIMRRLIKRVSATHYIIDGNLQLGKIVGKSGMVESMINADATIAEVICAGIVAKVERDAIMTTLHKDFPHYGWDQNSGYGTAQHMEAIKKHSMTRFHRSIYVTTALRHQDALPTSTAPTTAPTTGRSTTRKSRRKSRR